jgi:hypothetical protein
MAKVNWRKGLVRTWLVASLVWAALVFVSDRPDKDLRNYLLMDKALGRAEALANSSSDPVKMPDGTPSTRAKVAADIVGIKKRQSDRLDRIAGFGQMVVGPSFALLIFGLLAAWALSGFAKRSDI